MTDRAPRRILAGLTGLGISGGIACVSRCMVRSLDAEVEAGRLERADRIILLDDPPGPTAPALPSTQILANGSKLAFARAIWTTIIRTRPDLVLLDHLGLSRSLLPFLPLPRPRYALFVHGGELVAVTGLRRSVLEKASILMANSQHTAEAIARIVPEKEREGAIQVVPLCIEPARVEEWQSRRKAIPSERKRAALIVGRMWFEERGKGHDALIEGWGRVRDRVPDAELWIVGTGNDVDRLKEKARANGHEESIVFMGAVDDDRLSELYQTASLFAMPSRQEGFGLVYLEAMWHGLPCLGSTADAASCLIDSTCGMLVPYGDVHAIADAVAYVLEDPDRARTLGEGGRRKAESTYTYDTFSNRFLSVIGVR